MTTPSNDRARLPLEESGHHDQRLDQRGPTEKERPGNPAKKTQCSDGACGESCDRSACSRASSSAMSRSLVRSDDVLSASRCLLLLQSGRHRLAAEAAVAPPVKPSVGGHVDLTDRAPAEMRRTLSNDRARGHRARLTSPWRKRPTTISARTSGEVVRRRRNGRAPLPRRPHQHAGSPQVNRSGVGRRT